MTKGNYAQNFGYNGLGQKTNETISYGSDSYTFGYSYDLAGAVTGIVFPDGKTQTNISSKGLAKSIVFDGQSILSDMTYNPAGKPSKMTYGNGIVTDYAYDYANGYRLIGKQSKKADRRYQILGYLFDPVGNITMIKEEGQPELQKTVNYGYDDLNRLISANHSFTGGLNPINESYAYDPIGNMTSGPAYQTATFGSDTIGVNPHALTQASGTSYSYDARGNLTQKTDTGSGGMSQYEYNIKNEMVSYTDSNSKTSYEYDATGRRTSKINTTTATQYVNKLLEIELARVNLQALSLSNIRVASDTSSGSTTDSGMTNTGVTDSGATTPPETSTGVITGSGETTTGVTNPGTITESGTSNAGTTTSSGGTTTIAVITPTKWSYYIFLGDEKIGTYEKQDNSGKYIFHLDDHLGGSNLDTDMSGEVLQITDYLPYGNQRITQRNGDYKNKYGFIGKEKDNESGLNYVEARYYDSNLGRFVAQDRVFWEIGKTKRGNKVLYDPQQLNSYGYAGDNPVILKDPSGEVVETIWDVGNVMYDVGRGLKNIAEVAYEGARYGYASVTNDSGLQEQSWNGLKQDGGELGEVGIDVSTDIAATFIPGVPAGGSKVYRAGKKVEEITITAIKESRVTKVYRKASETILADSKKFEKMGGGKSTQGQAWYKEKGTGNIYYLDNMHKNELEVFNKKGVHMGTANPETGAINAGTAVKGRKIDL
ncbi:MAG: colicin E3/pyocin S6 family cytotoxin [Candidatus Gracilibacteria bacterium]|nr:colicin E3/pyocin S6 family cytotoxin [Candidatus Gracilibacteria bacterium]